MRTVLLVFVMITGYSLVSFAQLQLPVHLNDGVMKVKSGQPGLFFFKDSLNKGKLDVPFNTSNRLLNDSKEKEMKICKPAENYLMVQGGMPILKSQGSFPMPIYKPDSTVNFTIRIKEYKMIHL